MNSCQSNQRTFLMDEDDEEDVDPDSAVILPTSRLR